MVMIPYHAETDYFKIISVYPQVFEWLYMQIRGNILS